MPGPSRAARLLEEAAAAHGRGERAAAESRVREALALEPNSANAQQMLGGLLLDRGLHLEAMPWLESAARLQPQAGTFYNLGLARHATGRLEAAIDAFRSAVRLNPEWVDALNNLGTCLLELGFAHAAVDVLRQCLGKPGLTPLTFSNLLLAMQYLPEVSLDESLQLHRRFGEAIEATAQPLPTRVVRALGGKLRVGLVSGDFRTHPVGLLLQGLLPELAQHEIECWAYSARAGLPGDPMPARLAALVAGWRDIEQMDDATAARMIAADGIDILIDLSGHTSHNRLGVFARRPAPVQVSWLGYGATTGLSRIDYVLGDPWSNPPGDEAQFVERLVRMPVPRLPFTPPAEAPEVAPPPALAKGHVTFGCFNNIAKLNPTVVTLWASILREVHGSRLFLKGRQFDHTAPREALTTAFVQHGVSRDRLQFEGFQRRAEYYTAFSEVDIALDPFPFTGGTSTLDALWMGVPVVSLRGDRMIARQGEMILAPLGLEDWLCNGIDRYRTRAVAAVADSQSLARLRGELRTRVAASPAADMMRYAAVLAEILKALAS